MPDSWQFLFLFGSNVTGWSLACAYMLKSHKWESSYHGALRQYEGLLSAVKAPTPHQRAAETRRRKRVDEMRAHRIAMEADINRRKVMAGVHVPADAPVAAFTSSPLTLDDLKANRIDQDTWRVDMSAARGKVSAIIAGPNGQREVPVGPDGIVKMNADDFIGYVIDTVPALGPNLGNSLTNIGKPGW